jgi:hypothetical protein
LKGVVTVSGTGNVRVWVNGPFSVEPATWVNEAQRPQRFQVYQPEKPGGGQWTGSVCSSGSSSPTQIWALLFTPGLGIDCVGENQPTIFGAVVAQFHGGAGNHFDFHWDIDSVNSVHTGIFVIRDWRECPAGASDC